MLQRDVVRWVLAICQSRECRVFARTAIRCNAVIAEAEMVPLVLSIDWKIASAAVTRFLYNFQLGFGCNDGFSVNGYTHCATLDDKESFRGTLIHIGQKL